MKMNVFFSILFIPYKYITHKNINIKRIHFHSLIHYVIKIYFCFLLHIRAGILPPYIGYRVRNKARYGRRKQPYSWCRG